MKVFDGKSLADSMASHVHDEVLKLNKTPTLAIVAVKASAQSKAYITAKAERAAQVGIKTMLVEHKSITTEQLTRQIKELATNPDITGIIVQLPLPKSINKPLVVAAIPPEKDVDGMRYMDLDAPLYAPATSLAVLAALELSGAKPRTSKVLVIGQGEVGRPLTAILKRYGIHVTTETHPNEKLRVKTHQADVIISAVGKPKIITSDMINQGVALIDVGVSIVNGKTIGDVDFESCRNKAGFITPPLGGIGPVTVMMLLQNVVKAAKL